MPGKPELLSESPGQGHNHPTKVAVVGVGNVGATFAYSLLLSGLAAEIVLIDANRAKAEGEAMDLNHAVPFTIPLGSGRATMRTAPAPWLRFWRQELDSSREKRDLISSRRTLRSGERLFPR